MRPHSLFNEVAFEPGGDVIGWSANDERTRGSEFLRLRLVKEGSDFEFPALGRNLNIRFDNKNRALETSADLDPLRQSEILALPETLEEQGWRSMSDNETQLQNFCTLENPKSDLKLQWSKSNALLNLVLRRCHGTGLWSFHVSTFDFPLGELDESKVTRVQEQRLIAPALIKDVDLTLLKAQDWRQRKLGINLLSQVNSEEVLPSLLNGFYDSDLEVRQAAAIGLMSWGSKAESHLAKALNDPNPFMRGDALRILARSMRHQPHPAVYRLLNDSSAYVRISAVRALLPFAKDNTVIKTLMSSLNKEFEENKNSNTFLNDEFHSELVMTLAESRDVRVANLLIKVLPLELQVNEPASTRAEIKAGEVLREMKTWMGTDYLQSIVKKSSVLANRQKALSIMAHWRKSGDEEVFIKALKDEALAPHALGLLKYFDSDAVRLVLEETQKPVGSEPIKVQAR